MGQMTRQISPNTTRYYWYPGDRKEWLRALLAAVAGGAAFGLAWLFARGSLVAAVLGLSVASGVYFYNLGRREVKGFLIASALEWIERYHVDMLRVDAVASMLYRDYSREAGQWMREAFGDDDGWSLHRCEGSFFRWLRLTGLPIPTRELYQRLKARQVLVVPGENFFFGLDADWPHRTECLRLNCSGNPETVREALRIIADEVRNIRRHGTISAAPAV